MLVQSAVQSATNKSAGGDFRALAVQIRDAAFSNADLAITS